MMPVMENGMGEVEITSRSAIVPLLGIIRIGTELTDGIGTKCIMIEGYKVTGGGKIFASFLRVNSADSATLGQK